MRPAFGQKTGFTGCSTYRAWMATIMGCLLHRGSKLPMLAAVEGQVIAVRQVVLQQFER